MNLHSKYKHLVVSGCSFTHNNHETHCIWSNTLAKWSNMSVDNLAIPGAGNTHIKNSIVLHLEKNRPDPESTLVLVMWSGPERIDWITDQTSSQFARLYPFSYNYSKHNELTLGGNWWSSDPKDHLRRTLIEYSKYQSNSSLALNSWIQIQDLENYLIVNGYDYYFMSWFNYGDPVCNQNRWIEFNSELDSMGLKLNTARWLVRDIESSLGHWTKDRPEYLLEDGLHAGWSGHEAWLQEVLIPELIEKNILNEYTSR